jgi:hypothetical protein
LIDAKLFPGSSGSIVISRPTNYIVQGGQIFHHSSGSKQFHWRPTARVKTG